MQILKLFSVSDSTPVYKGELFEFDTVNILPCILLVVLFKSRSNFLVLQITLKWSLLTDETSSGAPTARSGHALAAANNRLFLFGGRDKTGANVVSSMSINQ